MPVAGEVKLSMTRSVDSGAEYRGRSKIQALSIPVQLNPHSWSLTISKPICFGVVKS